MTSGLFNELPADTRYEYGLRAVELAPGDQRTLYSVGRSFVIDSRFVEAIPYLEKAHALRPKDYYTSAYLARAHMETGQLDAALVEAREVATQAKAVDLRRYALRVQRDAGKAKRLKEAAGDGQNR
jgi:uncharacterized protein HemY